MGCGKGDTLDLVTVCIVPNLITHCGNSVMSCSYLARGSHFHALVGNVLGACGIRGDRLTDEIDILSVGEHVTVEINGDHAVVGVPVSADIDGISAVVRKLEVLCGIVDGRISAGNGIG